MNVFTSSVKKNKKIKSPPKVRCFYPTVKYFPFFHSNVVKIIFFYHL